MAATGGGRYRYSLSQVIRLHLLLGIQMVFIPTGEPGRNACVESFNHLWQERVLRRRSCPTLAGLRRLDQRFLTYYHYYKPHRGLTQAQHATRLPGVLRDWQWRKIRHMPGGFCLKRYQDSRGHLHLPMARGRASWIRKVDGSGYIDIMVAPTSSAVPLRVSMSSPLFLPIGKPWSLSSKGKGLSPISFLFRNPGSLPWLPFQRESLSNKDVLLNDMRGDEKVHDVMT